jgi:hypothetical protein
MQSFAEYLSEQQNNILVESKIGPVYHGTDGKFTSFKMGTKSASGVKSRGFFFTKSKEVAAGYGNNVIKANITMEDEVTFDFNKRSTIRFDGKSRTPSDLVNRIAEINDDLKAGYGLPEEHESDLVYELRDAGWDEFSGSDVIDGIVMKNVDDSMTVFGGKVTDHYVVFSPKQIRVIK